MKAYCIAYEVVEDARAFEEYRSRVLGTLEPFAGRFLVRGGAFDVLEGELPFERIVVLEFPSRAAAEAWYRSPAYQEVLPVRLRSTRTQLVLVDGVEP